jgi:subtilisin family serine protease
MVTLLSGLMVGLGASQVWGQGGDVRLSPDENVQPLPAKTFLTPTGCVQEGVTCVPNTLLAVFKPPASWPLAQATRLPGNEGASARDQLSSKLLGLLQTQSRSRKVQFSGVRMYPLPSAANLPPNQAQVCGNVLMRLKFTGSVNEAIFVMRLLVGAGTLSPFNVSNLYGIQPDGVGKPGGSTTSDPDKPTMINHGTVRIRSEEAAGLAAPMNLPLVTVAVLDTGWPDPAPVMDIPVNINLSKARNFVDLDATTPLSFNDDLNITTLTGLDPFLGIGHGTPVSSIIAGQNAQLGVAANAQIVPVKICNKDGDCEEPSVIYGTCYAGSAPVSASVINMSFGARAKPGAVPQILHGAITDVTRSGSLVVVAGGNTRADEYMNPPAFGKVKNDPIYPALFSSGASVKGSTNPNNTPGGMLLAVGSVTTKGSFAKFATSRAYLDLSAPGSWLKVLGTDGHLHDSSGTSISGTSFSTAYVSGAAALLIGKSSRTGGTPMTPTQLAVRLVQTANPAGCVTTDPFGFDCGKGMLDVLNAWSTTP